MHIKKEERKMFVNGPSFAGNFRIIEKPNRIFDYTGLSINDKSDLTSRRRETLKEMSKYAKDAFDKHTLDDETGIVFVCQAHGGYSTPEQIPLQHGDVILISGHADPRGRNLPPYFEQLIEIPENLKSEDELRQEIKRQIDINARKQDDFYKNKAKEASNFLTKYYRFIEKFNH